MARYNIYSGTFVCQKCNDSVPTIRSYPELKKLTWMCKDGHLSEVSSTRTLGETHKRAMPHGKTSVLTSKRLGNLLR